MKKFELEAKQTTELEQAFLSMPPQEGVQEKLEMINENLFQLAKRLYPLARSCPEQTKALNHLKEAQFWFNQAVIKHGVA